MQPTSPATISDDIAAKALHHRQQAEREAANVVGLPCLEGRDRISEVGVVGAGTMGCGIAMAFLSAGIPVVLIEREEAALAAGVSRILSTYEASVRKGRLDASQVDTLIARLSPSLSYADLARCDLVIEAVFEDMTIKRSVFAQLDNAVKADAILASNTSYLDIDEIAGSTRRPHKVIGMHFFSPANIMRLLEVVRGADTDVDTLARCMALGKRIGKVTVVSGVCDGFIGNRMLKRRQQAAFRLIGQGIPYDRVDQVLLDFGFPMGPFQMTDLAGLDLGWTPGEHRDEPIKDLLCEHGRFGQKNSRGFYDYDADRKRTPSDFVKSLILKNSSFSSDAPLRLSDEEILERLLYPVVNEGALVLEEGIAQRASDIDVVWLNGYGWPAATGGPMFWADTIGPAKIVAGLQRHAEAAGKAGVSRLLLDLVRSGGKFCS